MFHAGERVLFIGLAARPELDYRLGWVEKYYPAKDRWAVHVLLDNGHNETVMVRESNLSYPFTSSLKISGQARQWVLSLYSPADKRSRHRYLDKFLNYCDSGSEYPYAFVKATVESFFMHLDAGGGEGHACGYASQAVCEGGAGLFGVAYSTACVGRYVLATWAHLCRTENIKARDAIAKNRCVEQEDVVMSILRGDLPQTFRMWVERYTKVDKLVRDSLWEEIPWDLDMLQKLRVEQPTPPLCSGQRVRVFGLEKSPDLNGSLGTLKQMHGQRWAIQCANTTAPKLIRPSNLTRVLACVFEGQEMVAPEDSQVRDCINRFLVKHSCKDVRWLETVLARSSSIPSVRCKDPLFVAAKGPRALTSIDWLVRLKGGTACFGNGWSNIGAFAYDLIDWPEQAREASFLFLFFFLISSFSSFFVLPSSFFVLPSPFFLLPLSSFFLLHSLNFKH